jgi:hypothetical protein
MLYPQILLGLAATVSAIDAYFHLGSNCDGPSVLCSGLNPGVCCTASSANSVGYRGIPTNWNIDTQAFTGGGCANYGSGAGARGTNFVCIKEFIGVYTGTRYNFASRKKRAEAETGPACVGTEEPCAFSRKANELLLEDGTRYNIADVEDDVLEQMVS